MMVYDRSWAAAKGAAMVSPNVNKMLQQAKSLSLEERKQFVELLKEEPASGQAEIGMDQLAAALAGKGLRLTIPPKRTPEEIARFAAWKPIKMPGGSLSDELVRDRR